jgi:competence protein ComEA
MNKRLFRELFNFSKKERAGIIGLLFVVFFLIVIGKLIPFFIHEDKHDFSKWEAEVNSYLAKTEDKIPEKAALHISKFNPNEADSTTLINMGIPPKVVVNWVKYLEKGGRFSENEEVKKIFGMTSELFEQLDRFMVIPITNHHTVSVENKSTEVNSKKVFRTDSGFRRPSPVREFKSIKVIELNNADSVQLVAIQGIGPILASRIVRYRNLLGGYYSISQLKEVYGMREDNFTTVLPYFRVDQSTINTFNINFSTIQEIGRHPYIGFKTARKIFKLRDKMGKFSSPEDLSSVVAADSLNRLIPYLKFSQ